MWRLLYLLAAVALVAGCTDPVGPGGEREWMTITVVDELGQPVPGAHITCRFDWDAFHEVTDGIGKARINAVPGRPVTIEKDGYMPLSLPGISSGKYVVHKTKYAGKHVGSVIGNVVKIHPHRVVTISPEGVYRVYAYDEQGVRLEIQTATGFGVRGSLITGDTLWNLSPSSTIRGFITNDDVIVGATADLPAFTYWRPFAKRGSTLAGIDDDSIVIYSVDTESEIEEHSRIFANDVRYLSFRDDFLVISNLYSYVNIFDVSVPGQPEIKYIDTSKGFRFFGSKMLSIESGHPYSGEPAFGNLYDISDPAVPEHVQGFKFPGYIEHMVDDSTAICRWVARTPMNGIARLSSAGEFSIIYTFSSERTGYLDESLADFFIVGGKMFMLIERN